MARKPTQDERDFVDMLEEESPHLTHLAAKKIDAGMHPKDVATLLQSYADRARSWCVGRYGHGA